MNQGEALKVTLRNNVQIKICMKCDRLYKSRMYKTLSVVHVMGWI